MPAHQQTCSPDVDMQTVHCVCKLYFKLFDEDWEKPNTRAPNADFNVGEQTTANP
ncbi:unnamed protein product [Ixodes persulcatus]